MDAPPLATELRYTASHLWVRDEGGVAMVGLTTFGQERHGRVFCVGLPAMGAPLAFGLPFGYLQSAAFGLTQLYPPVQGEVVAINEALWIDPGLVNDDPYDRGWLVAIRMTNAAELVDLSDAATYEAWLAAGAARPSAALPAGWQDRDEPAFVIDDRRRVLDCNHAAERLIGLSSAELQHGPICAELFGCRHADAGGRPLDRSGCPGLCALMNLQPVSDVRYVVTDAAGVATVVSASYQPLAEPGQPRRALVVLRREG